MMDQLAAPTSFPGVIKIFFDLITAIIPVLVAVALLVFFWGIVKFIAKAGEKDVKEGRSLMIWGLIALFTMVSVWGILRFTYGEIGFNRPFGIPYLPYLPVR